jgi:hypothetical protein
VRQPPRLGVRTRSDDGEQLGAGGTDPTSSHGSASAHRRCHAGAGDQVLSPAAHMHENERGAAAAVGTNKYWREQSRSSLFGWPAVSSDRRVLLAGC